MKNTEKISSEAPGDPIGFARLLAEQAAADGKIVEAGGSRLDFDREANCGLPEFIYGEGKTLRQLEAIVPEFLKRSGKVLVTRLDAAKGEGLARRFPLGGYDPLARIFRAGETGPLKGDTVIVSAGTSDLGVALEAKYTLEHCGYAAELVTDVGVAGLARLFAVLGRLRRAELLIVAAGMEGALPSVVAGLVAAPVIAVPTSVGYGAHLQGLAPLLGMLSGCAAGVTVVNIDNGFGAACAAVRILANKNRIPS